MFDDLLLLVRWTVIRGVAGLSVVGAAPEIDCAWPCDALRDGSLDIMKHLSLLSGP
jgi:hypothetical protein